MPTENQPAEPFHREDRYIVIKRSDMEKAPADLRRSFSGQCRNLHEAMLTNGAPARSFVVVEHDWPEYHLVWAMIEHRMAGKPVPDFNAWRRADELQQLLNAADQRIDELTAQRAPAAFPGYPPVDPDRKQPLTEQFLEDHLGKMPADAGTEP